MIRALAFPLLLVAGALALGGCAVLPAAAPMQNQIEQRHDPSWEYYLVNVNHSMLDALSRSQLEPLPSRFLLRNYKPTIALRPGDQVSVSIFETGGPSLFGAPSSSSSPSISSTPDQGSSGSGHATSLPPQTIETNGNISIPFAGNIRIAGKTPIEAAQAIADALSTQALKPQVLVTLVGSPSTNASIAGDVNKPGLVPLSLKGERLLDVVAAAGGSRYPPMDSQLRIVRGSYVANVQMSRAIEHPNDNITIRPSDNIVLIHKPRTYSVMGAAQKVAQYGFDTERVTVAEAVARAGGDIDLTGDLSGVYIFRYEPRARAEEVLSLQTVREPGGHPLVDPVVPVIYKLNLLQSDGYLLSKAMLMQDKDVLLIPNAVGAQLVKFFILARGVTGAYFDVARAGSVN